MRGENIWAVCIGLFFLWSLFSTNKNSQAQLDFIQSFRLCSALVARLQKKYPNLTDVQIAFVFQGLRDYFAICHKANGSKIAMPSRIVDEAWHEFILFSRDYAEFCQDAFGHFLHHHPNTPLTRLTNRKNALTLAWDLACKLANLNPKKSQQLPLLFRIDEELVIPGGMKYSTDFDPTDSYENANDIGEVDAPSCG